MHGIHTNIPTSASIIEARDDYYGLNSKEPFEFGFINFTISVLILSLNVVFICLYNSWQDRCVGIYKLIRELGERAREVKLRHTMPYISWVIFAIYLNSFTFNFGSSLFQYAGYDWDADPATCRHAGNICLACYCLGKVLLYLFLVDTAHLVRGTITPRFKSKLYLFNIFLVFGKRVPS
ncbi:hypothetical protein BX600DRAFT_442768 [Xylariales sp. PMI_506]|nr:hypothetical protein BX600DRAFT_442768 [Xylariales sp. PMI_506]